jgi:GDPmannose 4,6-dehydratase
MSKRALVVGSGGQDGTLLRDLLLRRDYDVVGLSRRDIDILDASQVRDTVSRVKPAEIYYLAAYHHSSEDLPPSSGEMFHRSMDVHFHGLVNFLDAIVRDSRSSRLFYASSSHVFSAFDETPQSEKSTYQPQSEYAITKLAGMRACEHYRRVHGIFACVGILYNHESPLRKHVFLSKKIAVAAARLATSGEGTLEISDLDAETDWGAAVDYVDAMHRILQVEEPGDYVVASGRLRSVREFVEVAFDYVGLDYRRHVVARRGASLRNTGRRVGDSSKLKKVTGWAPAVTFEQMIHGLVQYELDAIASRDRVDGGVVRDGG